MVRGFAYFLFISLLAVICLERASAVDVQLSLDGKEFISGKLPVAVKSPPFADYIFETKDDILIPFYPNFPRDRTRSLWSVRSGSVAVKWLKLGKEQYGLFRLGINDFAVKKPLHLVDYGSYNRGEILGRNRISLPDGTFLEQVDLSDESPCRPLSDYHFMVENAEGEVLRRKAFLDYDPKPKKIDWNSERCTEAWGEGRVVIAAVHYMSSGSFSIYIVGDKILFIEDNVGSYLLTTPNLEGPKSDSSLIVMDLRTLEATDEPASSLEARDVEVGRALRESK
jgi:hypothetical protein